MGLDIIDNVVVVNHSSKDHLYTGTYSNPSKTIISGIDVFSVYRRKKSPGPERRDRDLKRLGDNCPLIYALKGKQDLSVELSSIKRLMDFMPDILDKMVGELPDDLTDIVTIPSAHPLAKTLAKRLGRRLFLPVRDDLLVKATCFEATRRADKILKEDRFSVSREIEVDLRNTVKRLLKSAQAPYSSKETRVPIRSYFDPLKVCPGHMEISAESKVLLVDDLLASGETILAANSLLNQLGLKTTCTAATWFGAV